MNYSVDDRMVSCQSDTTTAEYWYDDDGFRIKKVVNGVRTYYIYDEGMLLGEVSLNSSGQVIDERYYIYEPGSYYPLEMVVYESGVWRAYSYHNDHLMTPLRLTDENQEIVWSGNYSAFGEVDITIEDIENDLRFPGQYQDKLHNFYYNHFRYYIPQLARYNRIDPLYEKIFPPISFLLTFILDYQYSLNNPVKNFDFGGLKTCCIDDCNNHCIKSYKNCKRQCKGSLGSKVFCLYTCYLLRNCCFSYCVDCELDPDPEYCCSNFWYQCVLNQKKKK